MFVRLRKAFQRQDWLAYFIELLLIVLGITIAYELNVYQQREVLEEAKYSLLGNLYNENKRNYEDSISNQALNALKDKAFLNRVVILSAIETEHLRVYQNALNQIETVDSLIIKQLHH